MKSFCGDSFDSNVWKWIEKTPLPYHCQDEASLCGLQFAEPCSRPFNRIRTERFPVPQHYSFECYVPISMFADRVRQVRNQNLTDAAALQVVVQERLKFPTGAPSR